MDWHTTRSNIWEWPILNYIKAIKTNCSILDLGCGNARLISALILSQKERTINPKIEYIGIDSAKKFTTLNKKSYSKTKHINPKFYTKDAIDINYKDRFDYVFSIAALHHIPTAIHQKKFLKKIYNSLKKDGILILSVWNRFQEKYKEYSTKTYQNNLLKDLPDKYKELHLSLNENELLVPWRKTKNYRYIYCFSKKQLKEITEETGFKEINIFYADKHKKTTKQDGLNLWLIAKR